MIVVELPFPFASSHRRDLDVVTLLSVEGHHPQSLLPFLLSVPFLTATLVELRCRPLSSLPLVSPPSHDPNPLHLPPDQALLSRFFLFRYRLRPPPLSPISPIPISLLSWSFSLFPLSLSPPTSPFLSTTDIDLSLPSQFSLFPFSLSANHHCPPSPNTTSAAHFPSSLSSSVFAIVAVIVVAVHRLPLLPLLCCGLHLCCPPPSPPLSSSFRRRPPLVPASTASTASFLQTHGKPSSLCSGIFGWVKEMGYWPKHGMG